MAYKGFVKTSSTTIPVDTIFTVEKTGKGILKTISIELDGTDAATVYTHIILSIDGVQQLDQPQYVLYGPVRPLDATKLPASGENMTLSEYDGTSQLYRFTWKVNLPFSSSVSIAFKPDTGVADVHAYAALEGIEEV